MCSTWSSSWVSGRGDRVGTLQLNHLHIVFPFSFNALLELLDCHQHACVTVPTLQHLGQGGRSEGSGH